jgi:transcriptional regulator with PAS, ATPase and Fis domain
MMLKTALAHLEQDIIQRAVATSPTRRAAAQKLGISLRTLYYKLKCHTPEPECQRAPVSPDVLVGRGQP